MRYLCCTSILIRLSWDSYGSRSAKPSWKSFSSSGRTVRLWQLTSLKIYYSFILPFVTFFSSSWLYSSTSRHGSNGFKSSLLSSSAALSLFIASLAKDYCISTNSPKLPDSLWDEVAVCIEMRWAELIGMMLLRLSLFSLSIDILSALCFFISSYLLLNLPLPSPTALSLYLKLLPMNPLQLKSISFNTLLLVLDDFRSEGACELRAICWPVWVKIEFGRDSPKVHLFL